MASPKEIIEKARRVLGPVAGTIGREVLEKCADESKFEEMYIEKLSEITGNRKLVENIIKA